MCTQRVGANLDVSECGWKRGCKREGRTCGKRWSIQIKLLLYVKAQSWFWANDSNSRVYGNINKPFMMNWVKGNTVLNRLVHKHPGGKLRHSSQLPSSSQFGLDLSQEDTSWNKSEPPLKPSKDSQHWTSPSDSFSSWNLKGSPFDILPKTYLLALIHLGIILTLLLLSSINIWSSAFQDYIQKREIALENQTSHGFLPHDPCLKRPLIFPVFSFCWSGFFHIWWVEKPSHKLYKYVM